MNNPEIDEKRLSESEHKKIRKKRRNTRVLPLHLSVLQCDKTLPAETCWKSPNCKYVCKDDTTCTEGHCTKLEESDHPESLKQAYDQRRQYQHFLPSMTQEQYAAMEEEFCQKGTKNTLKCPYQSFQCYDDKQCWPLGETEGVMGIAPSSQSKIFDFNQRGQTRTELAAEWTKDWAKEKVSSDPPSSKNVRFKDDNPCDLAFRPITRGSEDPDPDAYCQHLEDRPCYVRSLKGHTCCYSKQSSECIQKELKDLEEIYAEKGYERLWNVLEIVLLRNPNHVSKNLFQHLEKENNNIRQEWSTFRQKIAKLREELEGRGSYLPKSSPPLTEKGRTGRLKDGRTLKKNKTF